MFLWLFLETNCFSAQSQCAVARAQQRICPAAKTLAAALYADRVRLIFCLALEGDGASGPMGVKATTSHLNARRIFTRDKLFAVAARQLDRMLQVVDQRLLDAIGEHALAEVDLWLAKIAADIVPVDAELVDLATQAWLTYGWGRHPAALNFTDCCSNVMAKRADEPLLFVGNDFAAHRYRVCAMMEDDVDTSSEAHSALPSSTPAVTIGVGAVDRRTG